MARGRMSLEHKEALARGRQQAKVVREYLEALRTDGRRRRSINRQSLEAKIQRLQAQIDEEPNVARRVQLIQQRLDAERRLAALEESADRRALEREFIAVAKEYSQRRGITYTAWREVGVPAAVLGEAGITRNPTESRLSEVPGLQRRDPAHGHQAEH